MANITNYQAGGAFLPAVPARITSADPWNFDVAPTVGTDAGQGAQTITTNSNTQTLTNKTIASSSTVPYISDATGAGSIKLARGTATFVSGAVTVATGLTGVTALVGTLNATGFATGATEITNFVCNPAPTGTTGAITLEGYRLFTATKSVSGTGTINWIAVGT